MKNLIIYATKHGSTKKCAELLRTKLNGKTTIVSVDDRELPDLDHFDNIVIGGSIYFGKIQKKLFKFVENNLDLLLSKRVAFFICSGEEKMEYIVKSFPNKLLNQAVSKQFFGGELIMSKMSFFEKIILKIIKAKDYSRISESNIEELANNINKN